MRLDPIKLQWFEDLLWNRMTKLKAVEKRLASELDDALTSSLGELSAYDQHPGDLGSEAFERSKDFGLLEATRRQLELITAALKAVETGEYGICRRCGETIPEGRLEAVPETPYCVDCSQQLEQRPGSGRPLEEKVLASHLGRQYTEESWERAAEHGTASDMPDGNEQEIE